MLQNEESRCKKLEASRKAFEADRNKLHHLLGEKESEIKVTLDKKSNRRVYFGILTWVLGTLVISIIRYNLKYALLLEPYNFLCYLHWSNNSSFGCSL